MTGVIGLADAIRYVGAHQNQSRGRMRDSKDKRKSVPDHAETQSLDEQILDMAGGDDTQRMRALTVQELERLLKDKKPVP